MWYDHLTNGHVLRMQKIVRHWLLVTRWRKLVQTAQSSSVTKGLRDRAKAIKEVVTSEERYLRDLMRLVEVKSPTMSSYVFLTLYLFQQQQQ